MNMTREQAIDKLVDLDVAKWGEGERAAARRMRVAQCPTVGLALNSLAHYDPLNIDEALAREAKHLLTDADWHTLKQGG